jgi:hypothetical protein
MSDLDKGIKNLEEKLKDKKLKDPHVRKILEMQLADMRGQQTMREMSPQPFYKDEP